MSELTYVTIIGARYPELDTVQNDIIQFGNYLQAEQCTRGGFVVANKGDLAVLHNRNKMVNAFANTE